jgi:DNA repair protein RecO (recombination protein O)
MQYKTKAIVLKNIKYNDSSIITHLYTKEFGKQTYFLKGIRSKKSKIKINLFQALSILEIDTIQKAKSNIYSIKEAKPNYIINEANNNILKSSISFFIAEILYKVTENEEMDKNLFSFIEEFIIELDNSVKVNNLHIIFLIRLTSYLGFLPNTNENNFEFNNSFSFNYITVFNTILNSNEYNISLPEINKSNRNELLHLILNYYSIHLPNFNEIKSLKVLEEVFN